MHSSASLNFLDKRHQRVTSTVFVNHIGTTMLKHGIQKQTRASLRCKAISHRNVTGEGITQKR